MFVVTLIVAVQVVTVLVVVHAWRRSLAHHTQRAQDAVAKLNRDYLLAVMRACEAEAPSTARLLRTLVLFGGSVEQIVSAWVQDERRRAVESDAAPTAPVYAHKLPSVDEDMRRRVAAADVMNRWKKDPRK